jgi:hypothetical protein
VGRNCCLDFTSAGQLNKMAPRFDILRGTLQAD